MQRATSWSRIARDTSALESREATNVSPCIAFNAIGLFASYFLRIVLPNSPYIFATVTNVSFLLASFYIQHRVTSTYDTKEDGESIKDSYFISNLATCASIFLALLGASSLAFHSESVLFQPSHIFHLNAHSSVDPCAATTDAARHTFPCEQHSGDFVRCRTCGALDCRSVYWCVDLSRKRGRCPWLACQGHLA